MEVLDDSYHGDKHLSTIEDLIDVGYQTDSYRYIREGWEIFKKNPGMFVVYTILVALIGVALSRVKLGFILNMVISPCLSAGWFIVARKLSHNEDVDLRDFFDGFKYWKKLIPYFIIAWIFKAIGFVFLFFPGVYLAISYLFIIPIVLFYKEDLLLIEVLEGSRKVITKKWWNFLGFAALLLLVNLAGALALGVGLLVSIPVSTCAMYMAYEDIFGVSGANDPG